MPSLPLAPPPDPLAPFLAELDRRTRQIAREEHEKLLAEREAAAADAVQNETLLNVKQTADLLGVKPQTAWEWQKRGVLKSYKLGGRLMFRRGEVLAALQAQTGPDGRRKYARRTLSQKRNRGKNETAARV